jgi:hypothetical protein
MFEIAVLCVIAFAIFYSATLWSAGRRDDVLHGEFISRQQPDVAPAPPVPQRRLQSLLHSIERDLQEVA